MPLLAKARSFLRNLFFAHRVDADLNQEVDSHLEMLIEEKIRTGMTPAEAHRAERILNPDSMELFFQGLAWLNKGINPENMARARGFLSALWRSIPAT